jgi:hypothetical protein
MGWICRECRTKYSSTNGKKPMTFPVWDDGHKCVVISLEADRTLTILNTIENCTVTDTPSVIDAIRKDILTGP